MKTFKTDDNNDWLQGQDGNLIVISGRSAIAQETKHYAATLRGEMIHAIDLGIPYFRDILKKTPNLSLVESSLRKRILTVNGVQSITSLNAIIDDEVIKYTAIIQSEYGEISINDEL